MKKQVYVDDSPIHGKGLFAGCDIPKGTVIGVVKGVAAKKDGPYVLWLNENEGIRVRCNLRFINHSKRPNAAYYDTLEVIALRDIRQGEEITHDYEQ
ncbi:MAG TPA: SET domain-containing protein-lysine N-methyltransferase [Gammaproteobacteria bacterium]|nr:SET domain-containing protein-lysine N-methyltransferase [Gammaproteobacteria bacterium]